MGDLRVSLNHKEKYMEYVGYLLLAGVVGFVAWRFYKKVSTRKSGIGGGGTAPFRGGSGSNKRK